MLLKTSLPFSLLLLLCSCNEPTSTMGEMNDTTKKMLDTTNALNGNMNKMLGEMGTTNDGMEKTNDGIVKTNAGMEITNENVKKTYEITHTLYGLSYGTFNLVKQGDTSQIRQDAVRMLEDAPNFKSKTLHATKLMFGFEWQVYTPNAISEDEKVEIERREKLQGEAILELGKTLARYIPEGGVISADATDMSGDRLNLYAVASTLHKINPYQRENLGMLLGEESDVKVESMLDLIQKGLCSDREQGCEGVAKISPHSHVAEEVLKERDDFVYTLAMRAKFLPLIAISRSAHFGRGIMGTLRSVNALIFGWRPVFLKRQRGERQRIGKKFVKSSSNLEEIIYLSKIINESYKTFVFLNKIGVDVTLDKRVMKLLKKMNLKLDEADQQYLGAERTKAVNNLQMDIVKLLDHSIKIQNKE